MNFKNIGTSEKNARHRGPVLYDSIYTNHPVKVNPQRQTADGWLTGAGEEESGAHLFNDYEIFFGVMKIFWN